jgi:uncharacterized protein
MDMFKEERDSFQFDWSHLGNIELGRPNLGDSTSVAVYRLMQYTLRDAAIKHTDVTTAAKIFFDAGYNSGKAVFENLIQPVSDLDELIQKTQSILKDLNIGILRLENSDLEQMVFTLTVAEDLDCSGLPLHDEAICTFDEGFIAGIFETFTGKKYKVRETDCWCTGDRVCRFKAELID